MAPPLAFEGWTSSTSLTLHDPRRCQRLSQGSFSGVTVESEVIAGLKVMKEFGANRNNPQELHFGKEPQLDYLFGMPAATLLILK
jgi:hypothetical protein